MLRLCSVLGVVALATPAFAGNWADQVLSYNQGSNPVAGFTDSSTVLGEPSRMTGAAPFDGAVTPFNPPYLTNQIVSIGVGGSLVVRFDQPITNDPQHPFGMDLLVFGNSGYNDLNYPLGMTDGSLFGNGHGHIEVSANGSNWFAVPNVEADSYFPTVGYSDLTDPYSPVAGAVPSDFTKPVNPAFSAAGLNFAQIMAAYDGSGGGTGVDIGAAGLNSISYVRITNPDGPGAVEIDAFSRVSVPEPSVAAVGVLAALSIARRRRRPAR